MACKIHNFLSAAQRDQLARMAHTALTIVRDETVRKALDGAVRYDELHILSRTDSAVDMTVLIDALIQLEVVHEKCPAETKAGVAVIGQAVAQATKEGIKTLVQAILNSPLRHENTPTELLRVAISAAWPYSHQMPSGEMSRVFSSVLANLEGLQEYMAPTGLARDVAVLLSATGASNVTFHFDMNEDDGMHPGVLKQLQIALLTILLRTAHHAKKRFS